MSAGRVGEEVEAERRVDEGERDVERKEAPSQGATLHRGRKGFINVEEVSSLDLFDLIMV